MQTLIVIPARSASKRLPNKVLADICGEPMIVHVWRKAIQSNIGPVIVACDSKKTLNKIKEVGGHAILTNPNLPSGTDRVYEAVNKTKKTYDFIINLQGDLPIFNPKIIENILLPLKNPKVDIATLGVKIQNKKDLLNPNTVKIALSLKPNYCIGRAIYFSRNPIPANEGDFFQHIGVYAFKFSALENFVKLPVSTLEKREKLEQLRAMEAGMRIDVCVINDIPFEVNTEEDLKKTRAILNE